MIPAKIFLGRKRIVVLQHFKELANAILTRDEKLFETLQCKLLRVWIGYFAHSFQPCDMLIIQDDALVLTDRAAIGKLAMAGGKPELEGIYMGDGYVLIRGQRELKNGINVEFRPF